MHSGGQGGSGGLQGGFEQDGEGGFGGGRQPEEQEGRLKGNAWATVLKKSFGIGMSPLFRVDGRGYPAVPLYAAAARSAVRIEQKEKYVGISKQGSTARRRTALF